MSDQSQSIPFDTMDSVNGVKHTPGPWAVDGCNMSSVIRKVSDKGSAGEWETVARVAGENWVPDARLIAAAPELLAALRLFADRVEAFGEWDDGCFYYAGKTAPELQRPLQLARDVIRNAAAS